jgi:putative hydrolase of the HAD superfamily
MLRVTDILFDLDGTLYPASCGLLHEMGRRIGLYVAQHFGMEYEPARAFARELFARYGLTVLGLHREHGVDPQHYAAFVHDIDYASFLSPDQRLDARLAALGARLSIFTNAPGSHARAVLAQLGLGPRFPQIFDFEFAEWQPKPSPATYGRVLAQLGCDPVQAVMVEDTAHNLPPAKALGMHTIWIGDGQTPEGADFTTPDLLGALEIVEYLCRAG